MASLMFRALFRRMRPVAVPADPGFKKQNWNPWHPGSAPHMSVAACDHAHIIYTLLR